MLHAAILAWPDSRPRQAENSSGALTLLHALRCLFGRCLSSCSYIPALHVVFARFEAERLVDLFCHGCTSLACG